MPRSHRERHRTDRIGWLRASVLGANDGIVSTASLVLGVAAANAARGDILIAGVAGLVAGAMSMAAGEYVSVRSQSDTEAADLARERGELAADGEAEHRELAGIYVKRGLEPALADQVATQLMAHDALGAHARDELGISETLSARPLQAALASAASFTAGALLPLVIVLGSATRSADPWRCRELTGLSRRAGGGRCAYWRCIGRDRGMARHLLGSTGHGDHRWHRRAVRDRRRLRCSAFNERAPPCRRPRLHEGVQTLPCLARNMRHWATRKWVGIRRLFRGYSGKAVSHAGAIPTSLVGR